MKALLDRLRCRLFGHPRGRRMEKTTTIQCPRCSATWERDLPKQKAVA